MPPGWPRRILALRAEMHAWEEALVPMLDLEPVQPPAAIRRRLRVRIFLMSLAGWRPGPGLRPAWPRNDQQVVLLIGKILLLALIALILLG